VAAIATEEERSEYLDKWTQLVQKHADAVKAHSDEKEEFKR
jgi:hypothetical protein